MESQEDISNNFLTLDQVNVYNKKYEKTLEYYKQNKITFLDKESKDNNDIEKIIRTYTFTLFDNILDIKFQAKPVYKYDGLSGRYKDKIADKDLGSSYRVGQQAIKSTRDEGLDLSYSCNTVLPDIAELITVLLNKGCNPTRIYRYLCSIIPEFEKKCSQSSYNNYVNQRIKGYYSVTPDELIDIIKRSNDIINKFRATYNIQKLKAYNGNFEKYMMLQDQSLNNSQKEPKVLTGVKDIKEFSEPVQKIIPIFKGQDSDKIIKKEEIKIEEKTIIEENENETLINQIKVKQQELNQLIDKLCINLSN